MGHSKSMKDIYVSLDEDQQKARARKMYIKPKKLTPEEKEELKKLKEDVKKLEKGITLEIQKQLDKALEKKSEQWDKEWKVHADKLKEKNFKGKKAVKEGQKQ